MNNVGQDSTKQVIIERTNLNTLLVALIHQGYTIIGPIVSEGAIIYGKLNSSEELPIGWTDEQNAATYRLKRRNDQAVFGFNSTPQSWKRFLHSPDVTLYKVKRSGKRITTIEESGKSPKLAFFGVRPCDLSAINILDRIFISSPFTDTAYKSQRENAFIAVVNCNQAGGTCFCASMNTGPKATSRFDIALTEMLEKNRHYFLVEIGSKQGEELIKNVPYKEADKHELESVEEVVSKTVAGMKRTVDTTDLKSLLYRNAENNRWNETALRCLSCANCTMVCPTCFCATIEDVTDLTGKHAKRLRKWDSCFTSDFSYIHGGSIRPSVYARYRQWLTHKFAAWQDQFGTFGCVGCGRCITWCPVCIDVTEEILAIRTNEQQHPSTISTKENR